MREKQMGGAKADAAPRVSEMIASFMIEYSGRKSGLLLVEMISG
jgi:hypothetical protein